MKTPIAYMIVGTEPMGDLPPRFIEAKRYVPRPDLQEKVTRLVDADETEESTALHCLTELVRLKDLKQRLEGREFAGPLLSGMSEAQYKEGRRDYLDNQPRAWELARTHLASIEARAEDKGNRQDSHAMFGDSKPWTIGSRSNQYSICSDSPYEQQVLDIMGKAKFQALSISGFDGKQACIVPLDESSRETAEFIVTCVHTYAQARYVATSYRGLIPVFKELRAVMEALGPRDLTPSVDAALQALEALSNPLQDAKLGIGAARG